MRTTFIIGEDGTILKIMPKGKQDTKATDILEWLKQGNNATTFPILSHIGNINLSEKKAISGYFFEKRPDSKRNSFE